MSAAIANDRVERLTNALREQAEGWRFGPVVRALMTLKGIDFVAADRSRADAGIRLHYFDETTSFIFLKWSDIESHKVVVKLTDDEVRALEKELLERERKRQERLLAARAAAAAAKDGEAKGDQPPPAPGAAATPGDGKGDGKDEAKPKDAGATKDGVSRGRRGVTSAIT